MSLTGISANRLELLSIANAVALEKNIEREIVIDAKSVTNPRGTMITRYGVFFPSSRISGLCSIQCSPPANARTKGTRGDSIGKRALLVATPAVAALTVDCSSASLVR